MQTQIGTSPKHTKQSLKSVLSHGGGAASNGASSTTAGKKTTGSYKQQQEGDLAHGQNNLILSRGRANYAAEHQNATNRGAPNMGQMNYSKTLTQHMQNLQHSASGFQSVKTKGLQKRVQGTSTTQLNQTASSSHPKKNLHNRNGSTNTNNNQNNNGSMVHGIATPNRNSQETLLNSKLKKKKRQLGSTSNTGSTGNFQQTGSNSQSRGNLLISYNQLSYLKHSMQLQEARNNRDHIAPKKSIKSTTSTKKNGGLSQHHGHPQQQQHQGVTNQSVINQSMQQHANTTQQVQMNAGVGGTMKVGMTGITDNSFNNMTIRSGDKYNSTLGPVKRSTGHKRQISNLEKQVLQNAQLQHGHPLSAKNTAEKPKNIFQAQGQNSNSNNNINKVSSTQNLNQSSNQNLISASSYKIGQIPTGASKHYLNGGGSMIELSTGTTKPLNQQKASGSSKNYATNLNSASVFQRSHHQIYHSKNQSISGVSQSSINSRFTTTRPKNPTDGSLSSKGSIDSAPNHFGTSTNNRLKQKLSHQQNQNIAPQQSVNVAGVQSDYMENNSTSPQKSSIPNGKIQFAPVMGAQSSSKFNLVNRGVLNNTTGQFPAVINTNRSGVLSPKTVNNGVGSGSRGGQQTIQQSISNKNFMKSSVHNTTGKGGISQAPQQNSKSRKLSMKLSQAQLQPSGQSQELIQSQQLLNNQQVDTASQQPMKIVIQQELGVLKTDQSTKTPVASAPEDFTPIQTYSGSKKHLKSDQKAQASESKMKNNNKFTTVVCSSHTQDVIKEERVEESVPQTISKPVEPSDSPPNVQKPLASASAPNLNQSSSTIVKTVNLTSDKPISKQLNSLRQQLKSQILKQTSHGRSSNSDPAAQNSIKDINNSSAYNSNPQQPSSAIGVNELTFPMSSRNALQLFQDQGLSDYEKIEIQNYQEVYFLGLEATKIKATSLLGHNFGYDDERGDYQVVTKDHLAYRFEVIDKLGSGSFGQALKCFDHKTKMTVAIKVIRNKKRFQHQAGVELRLLRYLKQKDKNDENNIVRVFDYAIFRKHLLISFELLSMNLYEFIKQNNFQGVSTGLIRRFAIQILQALKFQRDNSIIHCDLKPENILLKQPNKSGIKIIDYGSSCFQLQRIYTYIQSRFYRAPEIVLGIPYTTSIDMWSFGCIMAELYTGYPLFPGENEAEQLAYIMEIKGVPPEYIIELSSRRNLFFEKDSFYPIIVTNSRGRRRLPSTKTLSNVLKKCTDAKFLDFIDQCLDWDPVNRMTPLEALQHEWILEGLPEKVLVHHRKMFGGLDDKMNLKEASLTGVQGFPEEANTKTIYDIVAEMRAEDQAKERRDQKKGTTSEHNQSSKDIQKVGTLLQSNHQDNTKKGYESLPSKTPNRSEYNHVAAKNAAAHVSAVSNKHHQMLSQQKKVANGKDTGSTECALTEKSTDSPSKVNRKIVKGFPQSQSTRVLLPSNNTQKLEKTNKEVVNHSRHESEKQKTRDLVKKDSKGGKGIVSHFHKITDNSMIGLASCESSKQNHNNHQDKSSNKTVGARVIKFEQSQQDSVTQYTETMTEQQDHGKSPIVDQQSDELTYMKRQALIAKNHQSQLPLKTINQLLVKDESSVADESEVQKASVFNYDGIDQQKLLIKEAVNLSSKKYRGAGGSSGKKTTDSQAVAAAQQAIIMQQSHNEEDDYEDMVTPTDDEGIASMNHTQKIPISLIKAKDKASKLFQPIPSQQAQASGIIRNLPNSDSTGNINNTSNNYFTSYGGASGSQTGSKKRLNSLKASIHNTANHVSMTPKQHHTMMATVHQHKGSMSGKSSSKGSIHGKVPSSGSNRNEYLSSQQTKSQYQSNTTQQYSTQRSYQSKKEESKSYLTQQENGDGQGGGSSSYRPKKDSKAFYASNSSANLSVNKKNAGQQSNVNYLRSK